MAHRHKWTAYTLHKAKCDRCGLSVPWLDLLREAKETADGALLALRDVAKAARRLRRRDHHLDHLQVILVEAGAS